MQRVIGLSLTHNHLYPWEKRGSAKHSEMLYGPCSGSIPFREFDLCFPQFRFVAPLFPDLDPVGRNPDYAVLGIVRAFKDVLQVRIPE